MTEKSQHTPEDSLNGWKQIAEARRKRDFKKHLPSDEPLSQELTPAALEDNHAHRWRIDEPSGTFSKGECKCCGAVKEFKNWLPELDFTVASEYRMRS